MPACRTHSLADYAPAADGQTDDTAAFKRCFTAAAALTGSTITVPPGRYYLSGSTPIPIPSHCTVFAHGASFILPERLGDRVHLVLFGGQDVTGFTWQGGTFRGHCFDPRRPPNRWEPNVTTRIFAITTAAGGTTDNLLFRDITAERIAGAVINVAGCHQPGSESQVETYATNIRVESCTLVDCGKFMWDYGLLWQMIVWPEAYTADLTALAYRYFHPELIRQGLSMKDGDDRVRLENATSPIPVSPDASARHGVCFFGPDLPDNVVRGRMYHVTASGPDYLQISTTPGGAPLRFAGNGRSAKLIFNLHRAFYELFWPHGTGPGKGSVDIVGGKYVTITGCQLSALGDTMHIHSCDTTIFSNNHITGSRMGAFFLAEWCKNSTILGNTIDGTNGSRVMSVEKSNENVTIVGNLFRNGGRGSWINQPKNLILQGNIFVNNTTKCERDPYRGRRTFTTGDYERYPELYFTLHHPDGSYGPVIVRDNLFVSGPECEVAMTFAPNGHDILVDGNIFKGATGRVSMDPTCTGVVVGTNPGIILGV